MKLTRSQLVEQLKKDGLSFMEFSETLVGDYLPADVDWNYKDLPHARPVHDIHAVTAYASSDMTANVFHQKFLGLRIPLTVVMYEAFPSSQTYFMTSSFYSLIVETAWEAIGEGKSRVTTVYSLGSPPALRWLRPLLARMVRKNYRYLMKDDIRVRDRRAELRSWGFRFKTDGRSYRYDETLQIGTDNLVAPEKETEFQAVSLSVDKDLRDGMTRLLGRSDELGLRVSRSGSIIAFHRRLCPHEGASLDAATCQGAKTGGTLICPWHARVLGPLAIIDLNLGDHQKIRTPHHAIHLAQGRLLIERAPMTATSSSQGRQSGLGHTACADSGARS